MRILVLHDPQDPPRKLTFPEGTTVEVAPLGASQPPLWDAVMHWAPSPPGQYDRIVGTHLNPPEALLRAADTGYVEELWRAHGISTRYFEPARGRRVSVRLRYRVHVCDLRVLWMGRLRKKEYRTVRGGGKRLQFVRRMAVRCLYVLGLHFGVVEVASLSKKVAVPLRFDPQPTLNRKIGALYGSQVMAYVQRLKEHGNPANPPVLLGADPEFIMKRTTGRIVYASRFFPRRGRIGYDQQGSRQVRGSHPIVELRPVPSEHPSELVAEIKRLLRRATKRTPQKGVTWQAGSLPSPGYGVGGHIHFSRVGLTSDLLRALDNYLAIPVMMLENPEKARRRRRQYGYLGEFRWKSYGGFEYRTLSSWIVAPHLALAVVSLAKLVVDNYPRLRRNILPYADVVRNFYQCDKDAMRVHFEAVWSELERLPDFADIADDVEVIANLVRQGRHWRESYDLRARWGLIPRKTRLKKRRRKG